MSSQDSSNKNRPEDILGNMFNFMNMNGSGNMNTILNTLMRNAQINTLRQMRKIIDDNIKRMTFETRAEDDSGFNPYTILGVSPSDTREVIDKAYRKKAKETHPDKGGKQEDFIKVQAAYEAIKQFRGWTKQ